MRENALPSVDPPAARAPLTLDGLNLLVVEDEYVLALDLQHHLELAGANVLGPVGSVDDALSVVERLREIDAAVLDVSLRGEKAYAVADALSALGVPFVFSTGYDLALVPERFAKVPVCQKPVTAANLTTALVRLLRERS